jgi:hypothetical protein
MVSHSALFSRLKAPPNHSITRSSGPDGRGDARVFRPNGTKVQSLGDELDGERRGISHVSR